MSLAFGMDVSAYQPIIDWARVKSDNDLSFVMIKASEAAGQDQLFSQHWADARRAGLLRGAYHFFRQSIDPQQQADFFLRCLAGDPGELPPVLDLEDPRAANPAQLAPAVLVWMQAVEARLGRKPILYTGAWWWDPHMLVAGSHPAWAAQHPLWVGSYPLREGVPSQAQIEQGQYAPRLPQSWAKWTFWQYSGDAAQVPGITNDRGKPARVDLDVFNGTPADLLALSVPAAQPAQG